MASIIKASINLNAEQQEQTKHNYQECLTN